jgi:hypothetical protein
MKAKSLFVLRFIVLHSTFLISTHAQSTAFTYQGRLDESSGPANGSYDFEFQLFDVASGDASQGGSVTHSAVSVSGGLFTVTLPQSKSLAPWLLRNNLPGSRNSAKNLKEVQTTGSVPYDLKRLWADVSAASGRPD